MQRPLLFPALLFAALAAAPGAAQEEPGEQGDPAAVFGETVDVRVVNVEAVVTDPDGNRVTGLGRDDFRLVIDGESLSVEYFTEVRGGVVTAEGSDALPPGAAAGAPVGTSYLVYLDELMARPTDRDRVVAGLRDQLVLLGSADRMAVVAFDGTRLEMIANWTGDRLELERAFERAAERPAYGLFWYAERRAESRDRGLATSIAGDRRDIGRLGFQDLDYADRVVARLERAVAGAASALRAFARPPGRKVMLLAAGDWPFAVDRWVSGRFVVDPSVAAGERIYAPLVDAANLLGYTLYPADVRGLDPEALSQAVDGLPDPTAGGLRGDQLVHATFDYLARETGGKAWLNADGGDALAETAADTRSYYWLGFTARRAGDEDRHEIRVEVLRPGLEVRARDSFRDLSRRTETSLAVESAVRFGDLPLARPLPGEVGRSVKAGLRRMEVPVEIGVPLDMVTLVPVRGGGVEGRLELRVAALDQHGETNEVPVVEIDLHLEEAPEPGKYSIYETNVTLRRARQRLLITLHDAASGEAAAFAASVQPPR